MGVPLELQLEQATHLKNVLEALSDTFREANFEFSGTGCEIQAFDTSGLTLVSLRLREDAFVAPYRCFRDISTGLNLADIAEVFRTANNNDKVIIKAEGDKIFFTFESENRVISYFRFDVDIDDLPCEIQDPSKSEYQFCLPSAQFMRICKKLSIFVDREDTVVIITVDKEREGVSFYTRGKNGTSRIFCPTKEPTSSIEMKENLSLMFDLSHIKSFSKVSTLSDRVTISLASSTKPAVFKYEIAGMGDIRYYIRPLSISD